MEIQPVNLTSPLPPTLIGSRPIHLSSSLKNPPQLLALSRPDKIHLLSPRFGLLSWDFQNNGELSLVHRDCHHLLHREGKIGYFRSNPLTVWAVDLNSESPLFKLEIFGSDAEWLVACFPLNEKRIATITSAGSIALWQKGEADWEVALSYQRFGCKSLTWADRLGSHILLSIDRKLAIFDPIATQFKPFPLRGTLCGGASVRVVGDQVVALVEEGGKQLLLCCEYDKESWSFESDCQLRLNGTSRKWVLIEEWSRDQNFVRICILSLKTGRMHYQNNVQFKDPRTNPPVTKLQGDLLWIYDYEEAQGVDLATCKTVCKSTRLTEDRLLDDLLMTRKGPLFLFQLGRLPARRGQIAWQPLGQNRGFLKIATDSPSRLHFNPLRWINLTHLASVISIGYLAIWLAIRSYL
jgi:hypothetical protein